MEEEKNLRYYIVEIRACIRVFGIKVELLAKKWWGKLVALHNLLIRRWGEHQECTTVAKAKKAQYEELLERVSGWELNQLCIHWHDVQRQLDRRNAARGILSDYASHPRLLAEYFRPGGKLYESYKMVLEKLLVPGSELHATYLQLQALREKKRKSFLRPGGYLMTQAGNKRKDLPWMLKPGSDAWKRAVSRQPRLTYLNRKIRAKEKEYKQMLASTGITELLHLLTTAFSGRLIKSRRKPRGFVSVMMGDLPPAPFLRSVGLLS